MWILNKNVKNAKNRKKPKNSEFTRKSSILKRRFFILSAAEKYAKNGGVSLRFLLFKNL